MNGMSTLQQKMENFYDFLPLTTEFTIRLQQIHRNTLRENRILTEFCYNFKFY